MKLKGTVLSERACRSGLAGERGGYYNRIYGAKSPQAAWNRATGGQRNWFLYEFATPSEIRRLRNSDENLTIDFSRVTPALLKRWAKRALKPAKRKRAV